MRKSRKRKKSLKRDFIRYFLACVLFVFVGGWFIAEWQYHIRSNYADKHGLFVTEWLEASADEESETHENEASGLVYRQIGVLHIVAVALWPLTCIVGGTLFYKRKLEKPIKILREASEKIAAQQLDFSVESPEPNELGQLCEAFERMRAALQDNYYEMWRQTEERKRLNAAFAHDLRTPLTVLKGQSEMLVQYSSQMSEEKIVEAAGRMRRQIARLEAYVHTMNALQRLEDIEIQKSSVSVSELVRQMNETGASVCQSKTFQWENAVTGLTPLTLDFSAVQQVYENLLANAVRFARSRVTVKIQVEQNTFLLTVKDDGAGFTQEELTRAANPFYTSAEGEDGQHRGMGLYICKILCEKHGGYLTLSNDDGAQAVAAFLMQEPFCR